MDTKRLTALWWLCALKSCESLKCLCEWQEVPAWFSSGQKDDSQKIWPLLKRLIITNKILKYILILNLVLRHLKQKVLISPFKINFAWCSSKWFDNTTNLGGRYEVWKFQFLELMRVQGRFSFRPFRPLKNMPRKKWFCYGNKIRDNKRIFCCLNQKFCCSNQTFCW